MAASGCGRMRAACPAGAARFKRPLLAVPHALLACSLLSACSLSTPSPVGGFRHDWTPRLAGPGHMTTRLQGARDTHMFDRIEDGALLGQTFGRGRLSQIDLVAEARTLRLEGYDSSGKDSRRVADGYYLGAQYKASFAESDGKSILLAYFAGAGLGEYSGYVMHADAHAGVTGGFDGKYFCPFLAAAGGLSLPYSRRTFDHANANLVAGRVGEVERYRYASAAWAGFEFGFESPFGNPEKGLRFYMALGQKGFYMFEEDIVSDRRSSAARIGVDIQQRMGLAWTY